MVALPMAFTMVVAILTAKWEAVDGLATLAGFVETSYLVCSWCWSSSARVPYPWTAPWHAGGCGVFPWSDTLGPDSQTAA
jgi:hypothetical protein